MTSGGETGGRITRRGALAGFGAAAGAAALCYSQPAGGHERDERGRRGHAARRDAPPLTPLGANLLDPGNRRDDRGRDDRVRARGCAARGSGRTPGARQPCDRRRRRARDSRPDRRARARLDRGRRELGAGRRRDDGALGVDVVLSGRRGARAGRVRRARGPARVRGRAVRDAEPGRQHPGRSATCAAGLAARGGP